MSGRHRILDEVKRSEICALVAAGCSLRSAANYVGCDRATISREALRNEQFAKKLRQAEIKAEYNPLCAIQEAAATHWRAAAWVLERTKPEQYARTGTNLVRMETVHDLVSRCLEVIAEELAGSPESDAACRRLTSAIENTCGELTVAAIASRDPKRLHKIIAGMSTQSGPAVAAEPVTEADAVIAAQTELLQNTPVAAK